MATHKRILKAEGDYLRRFASEDGKHYRHEYQDGDAALKRVKQITDIEEAGLSGRKEHEFVCSVAEVPLDAWLLKHGYDRHQWAVNAGGERTPAGVHPMSHARRDGGVKSEFLRWYALHYPKMFSDHGLKAINGSIKVLS